MNWTSHDWTAIAATMSVARSRIRLPVRRFLRQAGHICKSGFLELILIVAGAGSVSSQVLTPAEIKDPELRSLQQQYINDLKVMGEDIQTLPLTYHFYLNRKLDLDESEQQHADTDCVPDPAVSEASRPDHPDPQPSRRAPAIQTPHDAVIASLDEPPNHSSGCH